MCEEHRFVFSRRNLLGVGAGVASAALMSGLIAPAYAQSGGDTPAAPNDISPDEALQRLKDGNVRYAANNLNERDFSAGRAARAQSQHPFAGILSCADSRVAPELAFDQGPGELFVVRDAGNAVDTNGLASIEFGVAVLGIPLLLVLGHSSCGAISATIDVIENGTELPGSLPALINHLKPGVERALAEKPADPMKVATIENVRYNVEQLKSESPIVSEAVASGKVMVVGGVYELSTGKVEWL